MLNFYQTRQNGIATKYLREVELNSITWEYFTGDFGSVINYLEKVANHIWKKWGIDKTEVFTSVFHVKDLKGHNEKDFPKTTYHYTHVIMEDTGALTEDGDYGVHLVAVTVDTLKEIEYDLHCTIAQQLEEQNNMSL